MKALFEEVSARFFKQLAPRYLAVLWLEQQDCEFVRVNRSQIRQVGSVKTHSLSIRLAERLSKGDPSYAQVTANIDWLEDADTMFDLLVSEYETLRLHLESASVDPYFLVNTDTFASPRIAQVTDAEHEATPVSALDLMQTLSSRWPAPSELSGLAELVGFSASGSLANGLAIGEKQGWASHWWQACTSWAEFSLHVLNMPEGYGRALRRLLAITSPSNSAELAALVDHQFVNAKRDIEILAKPLRVIKPGRYRCLFKPLAVADLLSMFSWSACSFAALRRGANPLRTFWEGDDRFHESVTLTDYPSSVGLPLFNASGFDLAPSTVLVNAGQPGELLMSPRSSKEFDVAYRGGGDDESPSALTLSSGALKELDELQALHTGLLVTNVWYLNWSDQESGRVTGMTRDAAYWVENGQIVEPIVNVRFDARLVELFGSQLEALGDIAHLIPSTQSYSSISNSATVCPALLARDVQITL